jgi:putative oxidoreductase
MSARSSFLAASAQLERFPLSLIQLAARVGVGAVFFRSGMLKYESWEFAVRLFRDEYKLPFVDPEIAARLAAATEVTVPIFLFVGLASRIATLPLLAMILVIQTLVYPNAWSDHLMWSSALLLVLTRGPGVLSLDYLIARVSGVTRR